MKLQFKKQQFQEDAINAVCQVFEGQPNEGLVIYSADPGEHKDVGCQLSYLAYRNGDIRLSYDELSANIEKVVSGRCLVVGGEKTHHSSLTTNHSTLNLEVEMETGTGKTFTYLKTIYELNKRYGWSRFIIIVPSIAIREGVAKTIKMTNETFFNIYEETAESFIYSSQRMTDVRSFTTGNHIQIMVMNVQAFNATNNTRIITKEQDKLGGLKPIDVIAATRPILILDEPQKMEGKATQKAIEDFKPLFAVRYSATHKTIHNLVYRLDAIDAFEQKLVKQIAPVCIEMINRASGEAYVYCSDVRPGKSGPEALLSFYRRLKDGKIKTVTMICRKGEDLFVKSDQFQAYKDRFMVSDLGAKPGYEFVEFSNGLRLCIGQASGNVDEEQFRRIQIREAIRAHLRIENQMYPKGIKVLTLFFIDEVKKYRVYEGSATEGEDGEYARIFEEEYPGCLAEAQNLFTDEPLRRYQDPIPPNRTHKGYFAQDKKSKKFKDSDIKKAEKGNNEDDTAAYDLILKDKERLLSFEEPTRFIFSHSALREGWDNPNVFVICPLKNPDSGNEVARRQEVGRGLRLCVNQAGERQDVDVLGEKGVHEVNKLTIISNESYSEFVGGLQREIREACASHRQIAASDDYFVGRIIARGDNPNELHKIMPQEAKILYKWLVKHEFLEDATDYVKASWGYAVMGKTLPELPAELAPFKTAVVNLVSELDMSRINHMIKQGAAYAHPLKRNKNFENPNFKALWAAIRPKTVFHVEFESDDLIDLSVDAINKNLNVSAPRYKVLEGIQTKGNEFSRVKTKNASTKIANGTFAPFDVVGRIAAEAKLTRKTVSTILSKIYPWQFEKFQLNPERFIAEVARIIHEQFALKIVQCTKYKLLPDGREFDESEVFDGHMILPEQMVSLTDDGKATKHIYDWLMTDSKGERDFAKDMELDEDIEVYAKLPNKFTIPTPFGEYNPDWAVVFKKHDIRHVYFVAETKGGLGVSSITPVEQAKIDCATKHFEVLAAAQNLNIVYKAIRSLDELFDKTDQYSSEYLRE